MSFWSELRRRNVVKVGAAYAVLAWLLIQVAVSVFPVLGLPGWTATFVTVVLMLGFPVALLLAWAYELTPGGVKRTDEVPADDSARHGSGRKLNYIVTALLALAVVYLVVDNYVFDGDERDASGSAITSIAVLPFGNLSPDPNDAYFAAGLHEEILNRLARLSNLRVLSKSSVLRYTEDQRPSVPEIGRELNVDAIVEGSVRYAGDRILVTAQLIDAKTDSHIWSETYPGDLSNIDDIFRIQADIAVNIANRFEVDLSPPERAALADVPTDSPEAYALYLRALSVQGTNGNRTAIGYVERAVAIDPEFALARAYMVFWRSDLFVNTAQSAAVAEPERLELARQIREDAARALDGDPSLGLAHMAIAQTHMWNWRWREAKGAFDRALEAGSGTAFARQLVLGRYSLLVSWMGEHDAAIAAAREAIELDPNSGPYFNLGNAYGYAGDPEAAVAAMRAGLARTPDFPLFHSWLGFLLRANGDPEGALEELRLTEQIMGEDIPAVFLPELAYAYSLLGRTEDASRLVGEIERRGSELVGLGGQAMARLAAGDRSEALRLLDAAIDKAHNEQPDAGYLQLMVLKFNVPADPVLEQPEFVRRRNELEGR